VAYTGGLMSVPGWGPVAIDLAGLNARAEQISLLADHDATLDGIVGHGRAHVIDGKLLVHGTLTGATEAAREVVELARGGFKFQASVGVVPSDYERVRPNDTVQVNGRAVMAGRSGFTPSAPHAAVSSATLRPAPSARAGTSHARNWN